MTRVVKKVTVEALGVFEDNKLVNTIGGGRDDLTGQKLVAGWQGKSLTVGSTAVIIPESMPVVVAEIDRYSVHFTTYRGSPTFPIAKDFKPITLLEFIHLLGFKVGTKVVYIDNSDVDKKIRVGTASARVRSVKEEDVGKKVVISRIHSDGDIFVDGLHGWFCPSNFRLLTAEELNGEDEIRIGDTVVFEPGPFRGASFRWHDLMDNFVGHVGKVHDNFDWNVDVEFYSRHYPGETIRLPRDWVRKVIPGEKEAHVKLLDAIEAFTDTPAGIAVVEQALDAAKKRKLQQ